jgi:cytochrome b561
MTTLALSSHDVAVPGTPRHSAAAMLLHWGSAAVLVSAFGLGLLLDDWPKGTERDTAMMVHYSLGTVVLALVTIRLLRRLVMPAHAPAEAGVTARIVGLMHWALYAVMVGLPLAGVFDRWARGRRLAVFGDIVVPAPFPIPGGKLWKEAHEILAWSLVALVVLHTAAALWHHFVLRDGVLRRMLPGRPV